MISDLYLQKLNQHIAHNPGISKLQRKILESGADGDAEYYIIGKMPLENILKAILGNQQCILELDEKELEKQIAQRILETKYKLQTREKKPKKELLEKGRIEIF